MANLPETETFDEGVRQLETTDSVLGGPGGASNAPLRNLANRTRWLKRQVDDLIAAQPASETNFGKTRLATAIETALGQLASVAVHPAGLKPLLDAKAALDSPSLTGTPTAPTPPVGNSTTRLANTAFVAAEIADKAVPKIHVGSGSGAHAVASSTTAGFMSATDKAKLDGIQAGAQANTVTSVAGRTGAVVLQVTDIAGAAPLASPAFTDSPTTPTPPSGNNSTRLANTAFVAAEIADKAAPKSHVGTGGSAHAVASSTTAGFMSESDKSKLDGIQAGAQANTVTSVAGRTGAIALQVADVAGAAPLASPDFTGNPTATTQPVGNRSTRLATTEFVQSASEQAVAGLGLAGMVAHFAMANAPVGWLKANGAEVSRSTYANLFAAIGTLYGVGNGSTTFNLPDLRGEFFRAVDDGRGVDPNRACASWQDSQNRAHTHTLSIDSNGSHTHANGIYTNLLRPPYPGSLTGSDYDGSGSEQAVGPNDSISMTWSGYHSHSGTATSSGGPEARPRNIALLACIKY